jgi:hypothetical protein
VRQPRLDITGHDNRYAASGDLLPELQYCKPAPTFYGPGFIGDLLSRYLAQKGIRRIFGKPYHPQT